MLRLHERNGYARSWWTNYLRELSPNHMAQDSEIVADLKKNWSAGIIWRETKTGIGHYIRFSNPQSKTAFFLRFR